MKSPVWRLVTEWLVVAIAVPLLTLALTACPGLPQINLELFDRYLSPLQQSKNENNIVIVTLDSKEDNGRTLNAVTSDGSKQLTYAQILNRLKSYKPAAVLLEADLTQTAGDTADDAALAEAMRHMPVWLPSIKDPKTQQFKAPLTIYKEVGGAKTGHVIGNTDEDGVTRGLYVNEGPRGALKNSLTWQMAMPSKEADKYEVSSDALAIIKGENQSALWIQHHYVFIPPVNEKTNFTKVPYQSLLSGKALSSQFENKKVLIGNFQPDMDNYVRILANGSRQTISRLEFDAQAVNAFSQNLEIGTLTKPVGILWVLVPIWISLLLSALIAGYAFRLSLACVCVCAVVCVGALRYGQLWLPPAAPAVGILMAYVLWSWRRMATIFKELQSHTARLDNVPELPMDITKPLKGMFKNDPIAQQTYALQRAFERLRNIANLLGQGLEQLPIAIIVARPDGKIEICNPAARDLLKPDNRTQEMYTHVEVPWRESNILELLTDTSSVVMPELLAQIPSAEADPKHAQQFLTICQREYTNIKGKIFRVQAVPLGKSGSTKGWVLALIEYTQARQMQKQQEEWLGFLSHDLRSPQASILSLLALHAQNKASMTDERLHTEIQTQVQRTLDLAEGFIHLTRATGAAYEFEDLHLGLLVQDAYEQQLAQAMAKEVNFKLVLPDSSVPEEAFYVHADAALLTRAVINLLSNAIRHCPSKKTVTLSLRIGKGSRSGYAVCSIHDEGSGMTPERLQSLLKPSPHLGHRPSNPQGGMGLGIAQVQAVLLQHGGWLEASSNLGVGSVFSILIPTKQSLATKSPHKENSATSLQA